MDKALVEHSQNDVHRDQGGENQQGFIVQRVLEGRGRSLEARLDAGGEVQILGGLVDRGDGVAQGRVAGQVKRDRNCRELTLVADGEQLRTLGDVGERSQRDGAAGSRAGVGVGGAGSGGVRAGGKPIARPSPGSAFSIGMIFPIPDLGGPGSSTIPAA